MSSSDYSTSDEESSEQSQSFSQTNDDEMSEHSFSYTAADDSPDMIDEDDNAVSAYDEGMEFSD